MIKDFAGGRINSPTLKHIFCFLREGGCNLLNKETDVLSDKGTAEFAGKDAFAIELQHPMPVSI